MNHQKRLLLLIGDPVGHSLSPALHNAAIERLGLAFHYNACRVVSTDLPEAIRGIRALGIAGANVTIPHKEAVVGLLDDLTSAARAVGAVNTLFWRDGLLVGDNTDVTGFQAPLAGRRINRALILGSGGAARAVVHALRDIDSVIVAARRVDRASHLLDALNVAGEAADFATAPDLVEDVDLVVNCTPLGGPGLETESPLRLSRRLDGKLIYDLLYAPKTTRLMAEAAERGADVIGGEPMLRAQASAAFERWTGVPFPDEKQ